MYSIGIAAMLLGVCCKTLRRWDRNNKIKCFRTLGGHRRFPQREIFYSAKNDINKHECEGS